jgi:hypothetical protein
MSPHLNCSEHQKISQFAYVALKSWLIHVEEHRALGLAQSSVDKVSVREIRYEA